MKNFSSKTKERIFGNILDRILLCDLTENHVSIVFDRVFDRVGHRVFGYNIQEKIDA